MAVIGSCGDGGRDHSDMMDMWAAPGHRAHGFMFLVVWLLAFNVNQ